MILNWQEIVKATSKNILTPLWNAGIVALEQSINALITNIANCLWPKGSICLLCFNIRWTFRNVYIRRIIILRLMCENIIFRLKNWFDLQLHTITNTPCWSPLIFWNIHFGIYFKLNFFFSVLMDISKNQWRSTGGLDGTTFLKPH